MRWRTLQMIVLFCLTAILVVWVAHSFLTESDESRFQNMLRAIRSHEKAVAAEHGPWGGPLGLLHPSRHFEKIVDSKRAALFASGYLTNVTFKIPQDTARAEAWYKREDVLVHGTNVHVFILILQPNEHTLTC